MYLWLSLVILAGKYFKRDVQNAQCNKVKEKREGGTGIPEERVGKTNKKSLTNSLLDWASLKNLHFLVTGLLTTKYHKSILIPREVRLRRGHDV